MQPSSAIGCGSSETTAEIGDPPVATVRRRGIWRFFLDTRRNDMTPSEQVDCIVHDCFLAVGQTIGSTKQLDFDAIVWWHQRYREKFLHSVTSLGNSWDKDRLRVIAVGRYLGQRAQHHAGEHST